jgi:hypothetical protein
MIFSDQRRTGEMVAGCQLPVVAEARLRQAQEQLLQVVDKTETDRILIKERLETIGLRCIA